MKSHHCRHCGDLRDKLRPSLRRWTFEKLLPEVRANVLAMGQDEMTTAEGVATHFRARKGLVERCFHQLNLEGVLSQGINRAPHDSSRDRFSPGRDSAWCATVYRRL